MTAVLVKDTFDTARLNAMYRALESERANAHFQDPYARQLAGERGEQIMQNLPGAKSALWGAVARTCVYDEIIVRIIEQKNLDTVINLAAGLDTRPYRLELPSSLRWIEVDLPKVISYKTEKLKQARPKCTLERIPLDVTDEEQLKSVLKSVGAKAGQALVLTESLLIYLMPEQVAALATELYSQTSIHWWLTEYASPSVLKRHERSWNPFAGERAKTRFAPVEGAQFFYNYGWKVAEFRSHIVEATRLKLSMPSGWFFRLATHIRPKDQKPEELFKNMGGFILLERVEAQQSCSTS